MKETWNYERLSNLQLLISGDDNNNNSGPVSEYCKWNQSVHWYMLKADGIGESSNNNNKKQTKIIALNRYTKGENWNGNQATTAKRN